MADIRNIMIVDYDAKNIQAATETMAILFPQAKVQSYVSSDEAIMAVRDNSLKPDIVFCGIDIESKSGFCLSLEAWSWSIPVVEILEEDSRVRFRPFKAVIDGNKNNPETWRRIMWVIFSEDKKENPVTFALKNGKKQAPDYVFGKGCVELTIRSSYS